MANLSISKGSIQSVERVFAILDLLKTEEELGITQITKILDLPKGTVHGLVKTMVNCGYLEQNPENHKYRYGIEVLKIGLTFTSRMDLRRITEKTVRKLADELKETVFSSVLLGGMCVIVANCSARLPFVLVPKIGSSIPVHCTAMGKVLICELPQAQVDEVLCANLEKFTPFTIVDSDQIKETLKKTREDGYNITHQETLLGLSCIAAPIRDHSGDITAALSIATSTESLNQEDRLNYLVKTLVHAAHEVSADLGYQ